MATTNNTNLSTSVINFFKAILNRPPVLLNLNQLIDGQAIDNHRYLGLQKVPLQQIRGTTSSGRCKDFDGNFRLINERNENRWQSVIQARRRLSKMPPVHLIQYNGIYFVEDGHHRISVAATCGDQEIEAVVTEVVVE